MSSFHSNSRLNFIMDLQIELQFCSVLNTSIRKIGECFSILLLIQLTQRVIKMAYKAWVDPLYWAKVFAGVFKIGVTL